MSELLEGISCWNCRALCCKDITLTLEGREARQMRRAAKKVGSELSYEGPSDDTRGDRKNYHLKGRCGNLKTTPDGREVCGIYSRRPKVCGDGFVMGGGTCRKLREKLRGNLTVPVEKD